MKDFEIGAEHPKWSRFRLFAKTSTFTLNGHTFRQVEFSFPNGKRMGGLDHECGGMLSYPIYEVHEFLGFYGKELLDWDFEGYEQLENILANAVNRAVPDFFSAEVRERLGKTGGVT